jgi:hypothetical protein
MDGALPRRPLVGALPRRCPCPALALAAPRRGRRLELFRAAPWSALASTAAPSLASARRRRPRPSSPAQPLSKALSCCPFPAPSSPTPAMEPRVARAGKISCGGGRTLPRRPDRRGPPPPLGLSLQAARRPSLYLPCSKVGGGEELRRVALQTSGARWSGLGGAPRLRDCWYGGWGRLLRR